MVDKIEALRALHRELVQDTTPMDPADVPCGSCTACCRSRELVVLLPEKGDDLDILTRRGEVGGVPVLAQNPTGECAYLVDGGCSVYEHRPFVCRGFDCRALHKTLPRKRLRAMVKEGAISKAVVQAGKERLHTLPEEWDKVFGAR